MIYFDNAATGGYKPSQVLLTVSNVLKNLNFNPGRSAYDGAVLAENLIYKTREVLSKTFNNQRIERVIFTKNCTEALNLALFGYLKEGDEVIATVTEHNSVLRPLYALEKTKNIKIKFAQLDGGLITTNSILKLLTPKTKLIVLNAVSNVTGETNQFNEIGKLVDCPLLVDGAQGCGHVKINMEKQNISILTFAGHKGLYSTQGVGGLLFNDKINIEPLLFGGSGTDSFEKIPKFYPEKLECGTHNLSAICSLYEGVDYMESNFSSITRKLKNYTKILIEELTKMEIKVYSKPNPSGIVSFELEIPSVEVSNLLWQKYSIATRGGFHCAPLMHKALKTNKNGLCRVSLGCQNTQREMEYFLKCLYEIKKSL